MERIHTCCFTGGRPEHIGFDLNDSCRFGALQRDLVREIRRAADNGYTDFLCGMSRGFDLWAGEAVAQLTEELQIRLHAIIPFRGQTVGWPMEDLTAYENILRACSSTYILAEKYSRGAFHARNRFMVDHSSLVISWNTRRGHGGTEYTCRYAAKNQVSVINLADRQLSFL